MTVASVENAIKDMLDYMAYFNDSVAQIGFTGDLFWHKVDNSSDITYENAVKGDALTELDSNLASGKVGAVFADWFSYHDAYARVRLGLSGFSEYLKDHGIRINEKTSLLWNDAFGGEPEARLVFAYGGDNSVNQDNVLGSFNTSTQAKTVAALASTLGDTNLGLAGMASANAENVITLSLRNSVLEDDDDDFELVLTHPGAVADFTPILACSVSASGLLEEDLVNETTSITLITSGEKNYFSENGYAMLYYNDGVSVTEKRYTKVLTVGAVVPTIEVEGLWNSIFTGLSGFDRQYLKVLPMFNEVTDIEVTSSESLTIQVVPISDRPLLAP